MRRDDLGSMIECHKLEKGEVGFGSIEFKRQFFSKNPKKTERAKIITLIMVFNEPAVES
jgi:hypothetical protein